MHVGESPQQALQVFLAGQPRHSDEQAFGSQLRSEQRAPVSGVDAGEAGEVQAIGDSGQLAGVYAPEQRPYIGHAALRDTDYFRHAAQSEVVEQFGAQTDAGFHPVKNGHHLRLVPAAGCGQRTYRHGAPHMTIDKVHVIVVDDLAHLANGREAAPGDCVLVEV